MNRLAGLFVMFIFILFAAGCGEEANKEPIEEKSDLVLVDTGSAEKEADEEKESEADEHSTEIALGGTVSINEETILVEGESNLPEGTVVEAMRYERPFTLRHIISFSGESSTVNADGTFTMELPVPENYDQSYIELALEVKMTLGQPEEVLELYGENGENMEGSFIYPYEMLGETNYKAYIPVYILVGGEETEYPIEAPIIENPPEDYGETEVWVEAEVTNDHRYLYVEGKSNLLVGANVKAAYYSSEEAVLSQHWFSSFDHVEKDGSFQLRIPYESITDVGFIEFSMWPDHGHYAPDEIIKVYGEEFANLQGEQVTENEDGQKGIVVKLYPDFPEVEYNLPEDSTVTVDGDETKIQLPDDILFDFGESELREDAKQALDDFLESLEVLEEGTKLQINGHTDNSGGEELNQKLSEERAASVESYIREQSDLGHLSIETNGYGLTKPIASNENEEGRQKNRRVEFVINPK